KLQQPQRAQVGDVFARNIIHRQHSRSGQVLDRLRHDYVFVFAQTLAQPDEVAGLPLKIQFAQKAAAQISQQVAELVTLADFSVRVDEAGHFFQRFQIVDDQVAHARSEARRGGKES